MKKLLTGLLALTLALYSPAWAATRLQMTGFGLAASGGATTIFTPTLPLTADDTNTNGSFRMKYQLSGNGLSTISATLVASSATPLTVSNVSICKWDGDVANLACTTTPVELTTACPGNTAGSGFAISAGASCTTNFVSYTTSFTLSSGDFVLVIFDVGANGGERFTSSGVTNATLGFQPGTSWNQMTPTTPYGPGTAGVNYCVSQVQTL